MLAEEVGDEGAAGAYGEAASLADVIEGSLDQQRPVPLAAVGGVGLGVEEVDGRLRDAVVDQPVGDVITEKGLVEWSEW